MTDYCTQSFHNTRFPYHLCQPLATIRLICMFSGCSVPLGMQSGYINDHQITASSVATNWYSSSWQPWFARLDKQGSLNAWQAMVANTQIIFFLHPS